MSEEIEVGTERMQETIEERRREAGEHGRARWLDYLAVSTALFAVLAAGAALEAGAYANEALYRANQAVLSQTQAVDSWSQFQAESVKKHESQALAVLLAHVNGSPAEIAAAQDDAAKRQAQQDALQPEAKARDAETAALNREAEGQLEHHHRFAIAVTLLQVAIGLAAIAALMRRRPLWWVSLGAGGLALLVLIDGFTLTV